MVHNKPKQRSNPKPKIEIEIEELPLCSCGKLQKFSKNIKINFNPKVRYITESQLNKLNLYLRSITGSSCLDLNAFPNKTFKVFFADKITPEIQAYINLKFPDLKVSLKTWTTGKIQNVLSGYKLFGDFLGMKIQQVKTFADADFVSCYATGIFSGGDASYPYELDAYPTETSGKLYLFLNTDYDSNSWIVGTFYFYNIIHLIAHIFGLGHPNDKSNGTSIMPGCDYDIGLIGQGLGYSNNCLSTIMSFYQVVDSKYEKSETIYSRTLMSLDLQALRFYYGVGNNPDYIKNWIDFNCPSNISQTLVSPPEGATLNLSTTVADLGFNLTLFPLNVNPMSVGNSPFDLISSNYNNYVHNDLSNFGCNILDTNSYISQINSSYPYLNLYLADIINDFLLNPNIEKTKTIIFILQGKGTDYRYFQEGDNLIVVNPIKNTKIKIINLFKLYFQFIFSIKE